MLWRCSGIVPKCFQTDTAPSSLEHFSERKPIPWQRAGLRVSVQRQDSNAIESRDHGVKGIGPWALSRTNRSELS